MPDSAGKRTWTGMCDPTANNAANKGCANLKNGAASSDTCICVPADANTPCNGVGKMVPSVVIVVLVAILSAVFKF